MSPQKTAVFVFTACLIAVFIPACAGVQTLEYVKYENDAAVPRISAQDAKKEIDAGNAIFVDSRGQAAFDQEHLPGAIVIPFTGTDDPGKFDPLPKGKKIIVYCT